MNLLKQLAAHLEYCGLGEMDRDIFWGRMPDGPDACACLFSADSGPQEARITLVSRAGAPVEAYEKACLMAETLDGYDGFLAGEGTLAKIDVITHAAGMGGDGKKRELYRNELRVRYCGD